MSIATVLDATVRLDARRRAVAAAEPVRFITPELVAALLGSWEENPAPAATQRACTPLAAAQ